MPPAEPAPGPVTDSSSVSASGVPSIDDVFGPSVLGGGSGESYGPPRGGGGRGGALRQVSGTQGPSDAEIRAARRAYVRSLEALLQREARYPYAAQRARHQGRAELALRIARDGRVLAVHVARSSGFPELDAAALEAARALSLPAPPSIVPWGDAAEVRAPVAYVMN